MTTHTPPLPIPTSLPVPEPTNERGPSPATADPTRADLDRGPRLPDVAPSATLAALEAMEAELADERRYQLEAAMHDEDEAQVIEASRRPAVSASNDD